ncbi:unnamed protein product [Chrysodeixis includens]|uniref:Serine protease K12H4.7 n=1 Tax=Chrysodeixis includens TaxID=689277 RepID=A0A9P0BYL1_CHRIL|nr:unnamed protein product [Chrysodeixis includens]
MWLLLLLVAPSLALHTLEPPPPAPVSRNIPQERWLTVRLNQFMAYDTKTFQMRYYYNDEFAGNNIVIFVGGEWEISPGWVRAGLGYQMAEQLGAGLFYTEHRYYGKTRPVENTEVENLKYLTIDQGLADLAQFIQYVKSDEFEGGKYKNGKVVLVGCSYAGTMATWMRLAYPHVVDAAFSDSGPLHAQEDFPEYLEMINTAIKEQGGEACLSSIEEAIKDLVALFEDPAGPAQITDLFNTCAAVQATPLDMATFFWYGITETFAYLVQYAEPGDIKEACDVLTNPALGNAVQRLANWTTDQDWNKPCIESRYTQVLADHRDTNFDSEDSVMRLWTYQTCVEFGWYQTTSGNNQPFLSAVPLEYFHQMCKDFFSPNFDEGKLRHGIRRTNLMFGALTHMPDHVISVAGGHDPWSPMGPNATHGHSQSPVIVVPEASHCQAIQAFGLTEIQELEAAKQAVLNFMHERVLGPLPPPVDGASSLGVSLMLLVAALAVLF